QQRRGRGVHPPVAVDPVAVVAPGVEVDDGGDAGEVGLEGDAGGVDPVRLVVESRLLHAVLAHHDRLGPGGGPVVEGGEDAPEGLVLVPGLLVPVVTVGAGPVHVVVARVVLLGVAGGEARGVGAP